MKQILIAGATGFLGVHITREALKRNWKVISISQSQKFPFHLKLKENITNISCDLSSSANCKQLLAELPPIDACVHSIGTLFDSTRYKRLKSGQIDICSIVNSLTLNTPEVDVSHGALKKLNKDTAMNLIEIIKQLPSCKSFAYVSTETHLLPFPWQQLILDERYWAYKHEIEYNLSKTDAAFHKIVVRPGFMYSDESPITLPIGATLAAMNVFKTQVLPREISNFLPYPPARPLNVSTVANFIVDAVQTSLDSNQDSVEALKIYDTQSILRGIV